MRGWMPGCCLWEILGEISMSRIESAIEVRIAALGAEIAAAEAGLAHNRALKAELEALLAGGAESRGVSPYMGLGAAEAIRAYCERHPGPVRVVDVVRDLEGVIASGAANRGALLRNAMKQLARQGKGVLRGGEKRDGSQTFQLK